MNRREFIAGAAATRVAVSFAGLVSMRLSSAQQSARMRRLAMVQPVRKSDDMRIGSNPIYTTMFNEMKRLGYVEGVNLIVDRYSAEGRPERFPEIVRQAVATRPDVIFTVASPLHLKVLQSETRTIPIVAWTADPVAGGIASSLARPGGNVTGMSIDAGAEMGAKRIELLAEAVGKLSNVRLLTSPEGWDMPVAKATREAAGKLKIPLRLEPLRTPISEANYRLAFDAMQRDHVDGLVISSDTENYVYSLLLGRLTQEYRLPSICHYTGTVEAGALMAYAHDLMAGARRLAAQIVEILNGGKPADMPFFQETHFELIINLKAAKALGLEIPAGLVARADAVIE